MHRLAVVVACAALGAAGLALAQEPAPPSPPPPAPAPEGDAGPLPAAPLPARPAQLGVALATTTDDLYAAIDAWLREGDPSSGLPPAAVARHALLQQRIMLRRVRRPRAYEIVLRRLPRRMRPEVRDFVLAKRELGGIHSVVVQKPRIRIGRPQPADRLLAHYRRAQRRFGVGWPLLAAVNYVETAFGKLRNESVSGARGPMQFMPATWDAYGMGGNVNSPRDAILGAANLLHANGAPRDEARALRAYNPSGLYVRAVSRFARRIRADRRAFYAYYAQQVFLRSERGYRRVSSFGL